MPELSFIRFWLVSDRMHTFSIDLSTAIFAREYFLSFVMDSILYVLWYLTVELHE